ncbi:hypothetical protein K458DRAFT_313422 [Lentithecium fluviatile CBS 122367]|uniref:Uncharacterized protein n=1 Tax=Lentithecium fluviatile CBS 122367 TaxID=1168545 RepID=A0A6G1INM8_9PLEO|nr:hypothetical protein K458DRAFT_313422 [Lentithecium fluviatile CBS 122367]
MADIQTCLHIPTQPWEAAKSRFLEGLSLEEVQKFNEANLENLFYEASATQKKHAQGSKSWIWQERLASLVDGIDDYGKALDVFPNMCPLVVAPIWGSIRVVIQIVSEAGKFQEKMVDMLAQIGDVLPRFGIFQRLFSNHERLLAALAEVYLDVLQFCVRAKDFFVHARKSRCKDPLGAWKPFREAFEHDMVKFRKHQKSVEREADLAHMIEAAKARELEQANRALLIRNTKLKRRHSILAALPTVEYHAKHAKLSALRHPGTNDWLQTNLRFQSWLSSKFSDCLPCYGIPGSGKSVVAASVANDLRDSRLGTESIICYYYCDYADISSLDPTFLIGSLIKQVLVHLPLDCFDETFFCPYGEETPTPTFDQSVKFLESLLSRFKAMFLIIDGVDELTQDSQCTVLDFIDKLTLQSIVAVKVFVASRTEENQVRRALEHYECIELSSDRLSTDIEAFIEAKIDSTLVRQNLLLENDRLKREVVSALVEGAQGM